MKSILHLVIDELDHHFDEVLKLAGHAGRGCARGKVERAARKAAPRRQRKPRVSQVDDGKIHYSLGFLVGQERQVMKNVFVCGRGLLCCHFKSYVCLDRLEINCIFARPRGH